MPTRVDIGNGYIAEFPDNMSQDDIRAALRKRGPQPSVAEASPMAAQEHAPAPSLAQEATALAEGVGQGAFNVGGIVGERVAPGYEEARATRAEAAPIAAGVGYLGGAALGGGAAAKAIGAVPRVGAALAPVVGQPLRNLARLAATGGIAGGVQAGAEGQDIAGGTALGVAGGPLAAGAGKVVKGINRAVTGVVSQSARSINAMRALGKRLNMKPDELTTALDNFAAQNGREASLADIADLESKGMLKEFAGRNRAFGAEVGRTVEQRATQPPQVQTGSATQPEDIASLVTRRDARIKNILGDSNDPKALRNAPVTPGVGAPRILGNPKVIRALRGDQELTDLVRETLDNPTSQPLTVDNFENLRQQLQAAQKTELSKNSIRARKIGDVKDAVETYARAKQPGYGQALDQYRQDSNYIDAFEHGRTGKTLTDVNDPMLQKALISPEGLQGYAVGSAERRAAANLEDIAPSTVKPNQGVTASQASNIAAAAAYPHSAFNVARLIRIIPGIKASDDTLRLAAKYLTDPTMARQGVALLKRSGASNAEIAKLLAGIGGAAAGGAQGRAQGGPISAGISYRVGELGPETIVPTQDGTVIPYAANTYNFGRANRALKLTPQEQFLYMHGIKNMVTGNGFARSGGELSTISQLNVEGPGGRAYNIPSIWNGKELTEAEAKKRAAAVGWDKWPSYSTWQEADRRYIEDMHPYMDRDVQQFLAQKRAAQ